MLHPEKRLKHLSKKSNPPGPNEFTSAKKTPKGLRRAGQGKPRDGKRGERAHKELQRTKSAEDLAVIAKGEDDEDSSAPKKKNQERYPVMHCA